MNIQLSNHLVNQNNTSTVTGGGQITTTGGSSATTGAGSNPLSGMAPGSSVTGQVVETKDGTVTIQLADSSTVSASLKGGISLEAGSQVTFLVNSNHNNQVILSPLFTNLGTTPNVENALHAAELPVNPQTASMVSQMMEQGMSIDKDSLMGMYKQVMNNPGIDSGTVVKLTQMNLAVNELNASQLQAYENLNHQLSGSVEEISNSLQQAFVMATEGNAEGVLQLFDGVVDLLGKGQESALPEGSVMLKQDAGSLVLQNGEAIIQGEVTMQGEASLHTVTNQLQTLLSEKEMQGLLEMMKKAGADDATLQTVSKGEISAKDALQLINDVVQNNASAAKESATLLQGWESILGNTQDKTAAWKEMLTNPALGKLLKDVLQQNWTMEPMEVANKEAVDEFFEQLRSQTAKLSDLASNTLGKESVLAQSTNQLAQNVDFLNQLNQTFTYVQIPLKMSDQNANGDLYVYTNKKNLAAKDGNVSAFLHLDMDHLGSVDVYVTMEKQKVSTNFKVQDDVTLDLIEANIDLLNARLEKRGYHLKSTVEMQKEEVSVVKEMQKQMGQTTLPVAHLSFDARA
ncbi:MAG: flagellar hook-length control protein FliK [Lachnospiraceae bacterium]|nr:flagellar hook-length control protein FliK [Lachnospiraceae bacterium]